MVTSVKLQSEPSMCLWCWGMHLSLYCFLTWKQLPTNKPQILLGISYRANSLQTNSCFRLTGPCIGGFTSMIVSCYLEPFSSIFNSIIYMSPPSLQTKKLNMLMCFLHRLLCLPSRTEIFRWIIAFMHSDSPGDYWSLPTLPKQSI